MYYGMYLSAAGAHALGQKVELLSNNLANVDTAGFKRELASMMRAEAAAVPGGRFSLLVRCGVPLAVRLAPFDD